MIYIKEKNIVRFNSPSEFGLEIKSGCLSAAKNSSHFRNLSDEKKYGNEPPELTLNKAIVGDDTLSSEAEKLIGVFADEIQTSATQEMPSIAGYMPCVPEALAGEIECMRDLVECESQLNVLNIVVELQFRVEITPEQIKKRGIAILALAMQIAATRPINLRVAWISQGKKQAANGDDCISTIDININTTPLDLASSTVALTNAAFYRRLIWSVGSTFLGWNGRFGTFNGMQKCELPTSSEIYQSKIRHYLDIPEDEQMFLIPAAFSTSDPIIQNPVGWIQRNLALYANRTGA